MTESSSPARGGGPPAKLVVEGALPRAIPVWRAPSTKPLRVLVPLPVPGRSYFALVYGTNFPNRQ